MTEEDRRVTIFDRRLLNASVKWIRNLILFYDTTRVPWIDNILVPELRWGEEGNYKTWALQNQSGVCFGVISVPWRGAVPFPPR